MLNDEGDTDENPITVQSMYAGANLVIDRNLTVVAVGGKERRRKKIEKGSKK